MDCDFRSSTRRQLRRLSAQDTVTPGRERERARDMRVVCCGKGGRTDDGAVEVLDGVADGLVGAGIADLL